MFNCGVVGGIIGLLAHYTASFQSILNIKLRFIPLMLFLFKQNHEILKSWNGSTKHIVWYAKYLRKLNLNLHKVMYSDNFQSLVKFR